MVLRPTAHTGIGGAVARPAPPLRPCVRVRTRRFGGLSDHLAGLSFPPSASRGFPTSQLSPRASPGSSAPPRLRSFRVLSLMTTGAYWPFPFSPGGDRSALRRGKVFSSRTSSVRRSFFSPTMASADFGAAVRGPCEPLSPLWTRRRSPRVSSTAFDALPPDVRFAPLMAMDFALRGGLVRRSRLISDFCSSARIFAPCFLQAPLRRRSFTSWRARLRGHPCTSLPFTAIRLGEDFHLLAVEHAWHDPPTRCASLPPLQRGGVLSDGKSA